MQYHLILIIGKLLKNIKNFKIYYEYKS